MQTVLLSCCYVQLGFTFKTERDVSEKVKNYHLIPAVLHDFILWQ